MGLGLQPGGTLLSPPIAQALGPQARHLVIGAGTAVGVLCVLQLPETLGVPMAERVGGARLPRSPSLRAFISPWVSHDRSGSPLVQLRAARGRG